MDEFRLFFASGVEYADLKLSTERPEPFATSSARIRAGGVIRHHEVVMAPIIL
jgi:hypothetical protein